MVVIFFEVVSNDYVDLKPKIYGNEESIFIFSHVYLFKFDKVIHG